MDNSVFHGFVADPDDLDEQVQANSLTVETVEGNDAAGAVVALVKVDTNYKPDRTGAHPVRLTLSDALMAATGLINAVGNGVAYTLPDPVTAEQAVAWLSDLQTLGASVNELREQLLSDLGFQVSRGALPDPAAELPAADDPAGN